MVNCFTMRSTNQSFFERFYMQYALFDGFERKFLLDALEFGVLKD
ncbi:DNA topoisomerase III, partial [Escherichia coli]